MADDAVDVAELVYGDEDGRSTADVEVLRADACFSR
jgi:hypothetical protein